MLKTTGEMPDYSYKTPLPPPLPGQDDRSVSTPQAANNPKDNAHLAVEIFAKIEFCAKNNNNNNNIPVMKLHPNLLLTIWNAFTPGVIMYDKNNNFVNSYSIGKIMCITDFQKLFDTKYRNETNKKPARHTLDMKIKTAMSLIKVP